jgi:hypothetical protein
VTSLTNQKNGHVVTKVVVVLSVQVAISPFTYNNTCCGLAQNGAEEFGNSFQMEKRYLRKVKTRNIKSQFCDLLAGDNKIYLKNVFRAF